LREKFARLNRVLFPYQLSIPISGLEFPLKVVAKEIESALRSESKWRWWIDSMPWVWFFWWP